jgi:hypothetical protein
MLFSARLGQVSRVPITIVWTNAAGTPTDPTGNSTVTIYQTTAGGLVLIAGPTTLAKQGGKTGFFGTMLDISNVVTYPAGVYVCLFEATVAAVATSTEDFFTVEGTYGTVAGGQAMMFSANLGQAEYVPVTVLWMNDKGEATDPTGNSTVTIYKPSAGGLILVSGPTILSKQGAKTGFFGTMLSVVDPAVFGIGAYVCLFEGTIAGTAAVTEGFFKIIDQYGAEAA